MTPDRLSYEFNINSFSFLIEMEKVSSSSRQHRRSRRTGRYAPYTGQTGTKTSDEIVNKGFESHSVSRSEITHNYDVSMRSNFSERSFSEPTNQDHLRNDSSTQYRVNIDKFRELVLTVSQYWDKDVHDLPVHVQDAFSAVKLLIAGAETTQNGLDLFKIIDEVMNEIDTTQIKPNSLGAKMIGCKIESCPGIPLECSPSCAGSLSRNSVIEGIAKKCLYPVYVLIGDVFNTLTYGSTENADKAYVYVMNDFKQFSKNNIDALRQQGIKEIFLAKLGKKPTTCVSVSNSFVSLDSFVTNESLEQQGGGSNSDLNAQSTTDTYQMMNPWWWLLVVVILLVILGIAIYIARKNTVTSDPVVTKSQSPPEANNKARLTPNLAEFDYIGGMRPYTGY